MDKQTPAGEHGFTLVELAVVMAIAAILVMIAAPTLTQSIEAQSTRSAATDLYISLLRARSEAMKRNTQVTLTPTTGSDWASGWRIPDPANPLANPLIEDHAELKNLTASGPASVIYQSSGRVQGGATTSFEIGGVYPASTRCVSVGLSGEPQMKAGSC